MMPNMKQTTLGMDWAKKLTRKRNLLDEINRVVQWAEWVALIEPQSSRAKTGRPPFPIETMLRTHVMHDSLALSDQAMEEAFANQSLYRNFAG